MGTRALIDIVGTGITIYQHYDGYPDHTLPRLERHLKDFKVKRNDPDYFLAYLIFKLKEEQETADKMTGFGLSTDSSISFDIEYKYTVDVENGTVAWEEL